LRGRARVAAAAGALAVALVAAGVASATFSSSQSTGPQTVATASLAAPAGLVWTSDCKSTGNPKWNYVQLDWAATSSTFATGYEILRGSGLSGTRTVIATVSGPGTTTWTDTTVSGNSQYNYAVRATYGGWESPDSTVVAQTTPSSNNCK
jgi:hypothetical protein